MLRVRLALSTAQAACNSSLLVMLMELTTSSELLNSEDEGTSTELEGTSTELEGISMELAGSSTELEELSAGFGPQETKANKAKAVNGINDFFIFPPIPK